MDLLFRHLALLTVDVVKAEDDGRLPVEMKPDRLRNLLVGLLEVAMANFGRSRWEQGWKHLLIAEEDWLDVVFEAQAEHAAGVLFQPMALRPAAPKLAHEADDIDLVDEAEHDEVDEALLADDPKDEVLPDEVEAPAEVVVPTEVAEPERGGDGRR